MTDGMGSIGVLLADSHSLFRDAMCFVLVSGTDLEQNEIKDELADVDGHAGSGGRSRAQFARAGEAH